MWNFRALVLQFLGSGRNPCAALVHHHRNGLTSIPSSPTTIASASRRSSTPNHHFLQRRLSFCPPDKLLVKTIVTKDDYDLELKRIQDQSLPAIFCFITCDEPLCFYVARNLREINQQFPHVAISEIVFDAQADNYKSTLKDFGISYTPSFHFYKNGEKLIKLGLKKIRTDAEAYAEHLKGIVGRLYRIQPTTNSSKKRTTQESGIETLKKVEKGRSSVELILSKEKYNLAINRIQEESLPAVLCFATYSYCSTISASNFLLYNLSERFPLVAIYEFLLDPKEDDYETTLKSLNITSTPTFHFFKNGKKVDELACEGFRLEDYTRDLGKILENLYNPSLGKQAKKKVIAWRRCLR